MYILLFLLSCSSVDMAISVPKHKPIPVGKFPQHVEAMFSKGKNVITNEFKVRKSLPLEYQCACVYVTVSMIDYISTAAVH